MADEQKVAVVTGSALNIGRATALALARDGYRVMVTARSSDRTRTVALVAQAGGRPHRRTARPCGRGGIVDLGGRALDAEELVRAVTAKAGMVGMTRAPGTRHGQLRRALADRAGTTNEHVQTEKYQTSLLVHTVTPSADYLSLDRRQRC